jgi:TolB-like protein
MIYRFGRYTLDTDRLELSGGMDLVAVEPQVFRLLQYLIEHRARVVSKDELIEKVWEGRIVFDATLNTRINAVRRAVGDSGETQAIVRTVARRGFRFIADVRALASGELGRARTPVASADFDAIRAGAPGTETTALALPDVPSIVVLPFENRSGDPAQEYFSDGVTEDVTTALGQIRWLFVVARSTASVYRGQAHDVRRIAQELGVRYVVDGSVRRSEERVRITARLIDGMTGGQVWAKRFEQSRAEILGFQDELTETIIGAIEPELGKAEQRRARSKKPESLDAWDLCQQGMWHLYRRTKDDLAAAHRLFDRALQLDAGLTAALTGSVDAYYYEVVLGHTDAPEECRTWALTMARRAIESDPEDAAAHNAMGKARIVRREHDAAIPELELAVEMNPSLAWAHYGLGAAIIFSGRDGRQAIPHIQRAMRLSPRDAHMGSFMVRMAEAHLAMKEYDEAVAWARKALREQGFQWSRYAVLIASLGHLRRVPEAQRVVEELGVTRSDLSLAFVRRTHLYTPNKTLDHYLDGLRKAGVT